MRVLIADDNGVHQALLGRMVQRLGHEVDVASDGVEVLAAVQNEQYDLILLDLHMPTIGGIDAARLVRGLEENGPRPFIAALTVDSEPGTPDACREAGMDVFLSKPIRIDTVRDLLVEAAAKRDPARTAVAAPDRPPSPRTEQPGIDSYPRLDKEALLRFRDMMGADDPEFARGLEEDFVRDSTSLYRALSRAHEKGNVEALSRAAHTLKSNALMFGAMRLSELARRLERMSSGQEDAARDSLVTRVGRELTAVHFLLSRGSGETERAA